MENIKENVLKIKEEIENALKKSGRNVGDVLLCAASKTQTPTYLHHFHVYAFAIVVFHEALSTPHPEISKDKI